MNKQHHIAHKILQFSNHQTLSPSHNLQFPPISAAMSSRGPAALVHCHSLPLPPSLRAARVEAFAPAHRFCLSKSVAPVAASPPVSSPRSTYSKSESTAPGPHPQATARPDSPPSVPS